MSAIYEADHQIAYLCKMYTNQGIKCYAVSEDADFFFLQTPQIRKMYLLLQDQNPHPESKEEGFKQKYFGFCVLRNVSEQEGLANGK